MLTGRLSSFKVRLYFAFSAIGLSTLFTTAFALYSFNHYGEIVTVTTGEAIPSMLDALQLSERSASLAALAPTLAVTENETDLKKIETQLNSLTKEINSRVNQLSNYTHVINMQSFKHYSAETASTLAELQTVTLQRLFLEQHKLALLDEIRQVQGLLFDILNPLVDGASSLTNLFARRSGRQNAAAIKQLAEVGTQQNAYQETAQRVKAAFLQLADVAVRELRYAFDIKAEGNLLTALLRATTHADNKYTVANLLNHFKRALGALQTAANIFQTSELAERNPVLAASVLEIKGRLAVLGAEDKDTLFDLRLAELEIIAHTRILLENHRRQATQLTSHANALVAQVRENVADAQRVMANQQAMSAFILVMVCLGNVLLAFLIAYFTTRVLSRHEADLREAKNLAETVNKELDAFTYSVSHDLQAPLRTIDGFSGALLEDYGDKLDAAGKSYLNYLQEGSREMSELIDGLLELSRCTRSALISARVNLSAIAEAVCKNLQKTSSTRQVNVRIAPQIEAEGDFRLLKTMLENLFGNAWKYTSKKANAYIEFGSEQQGGKTVYFIKDNGIGFDMTDADRLFLPFHRLHGSGEFEGFGIGLTTVQRIVHRHGGQIWAQSTVDEGTTFYFTLTASQTEKPNRKTNTKNFGTHRCA